MKKLVFVCALCTFVLIGGFALRAEDICCGNPNDKECTRVKQEGRPDVIFYGPVVPCIGG